ncbi:BNR-4 repeat-containing protein [Tamlana fucoidanivorans]|uniref:T9SS type A sorting domain-containing protein n=1 Tax=Allotamlana fucoidanivorans TaxID=2583814 RepID=A0A5C4SNH9_9FLAO|nr:Ig-like domain-containing protein [Tamlana fucoidanivorans]TNJ44972.1 T9SS type A sorting domain-containing protein [Tamlana fucoidanivorans]
MNKITRTNVSIKSHLKLALALCIFFSSVNVFLAQVQLEQEIKISDLGLYFDGSKVTGGASNTGETAPYDYFFGRVITPHGDCIKAYNEYVFMTWYRGGKADRHVMLTRYNTNTGSMVTIEFPHRHTGYQNKWWIGESHNTIAVGISPLDGTIHLLYDMHAYSATKPSDGSLANDYFRYSYSIANAASLPDADFTLDKFVQNGSGGYKHLRMPGSAPQSEFVALTYPKFFLNDGGELFMLMREGGNNNGMYKFIKYNASTGNWGNFTDFNALNAKSQPGITYNWGLYGEMKYINGKLRIGFQRRSSNNTDKFEYQNGVYYAYSDNQDGVGGWKNQQGQSFSTPLYDADFIKVMEPGDYVQTTQTNMVRIVDGFDWTVTSQGDVHIISKVKDNEFNVTKYLHTYKPSGSSNFVTSEDFSGASDIYTAGNSIYIIGLTSGGRVFVEKAAGGTNNFTRIYEATGGKVFNHGKVHIANGKLFYYLMEKQSGNAQPIYLQIIDLDIPIEVPSHSVTLTTPDDNATYLVGEPVTISASTAVTGGSTITKVNFRINNVFNKQDTTAPYTYIWTPDTPGTYTIDAVAYNANNEKEYSNVRTITVNATIPPEVNFVQPSGDIVLDEGYSLSAEVNATDADGTIEKVELFIDGILIRQEIVAPYEWGQAGTPNSEELNGLSAGTYTLTAIATDNDGLTAESSITLTVNTVVPPEVSFVQPSGDIVLDEGYSLSAEVNATDADGTIEKVELFIDGTLIREEIVAPYEWGQSGTPNSEELNGLSAGTYTLTAIATDNDGLTAESSITLTVNTVGVSIESVEEEQGTNVAANLIDGNTSDDSRWSARGFPKSVVFDLGVSRQITGTQMWTYKSRAYQYRVETSNSPDSGFVTFADETGNTSNAQPLTTNSSANARYVKLTITGAHNYNSNWVSINEFEILTGSSAKSVASKIVSVKEKNVEVKVYPNPAKERFTIQLEGINSADLKMYDMLGKLVYTKKLQGETKEEITEQFESGIYLLSIYDEEGTMHTHRLIIN